MQVIRDPSATASISDLHIRRLVEQRIYAIASDEPYDANLHGIFVVLAPAGDTAEAITATIGFDPTQRAWEILEEYPTCYDLLFVIDDSGYGIELFIPKTIDIPELLNLCQRHATPGTV
jgi:hypothetical protein